MNDFCLYWRYLRLNFLAGLQYKGWPMVTVAVCITVITEPMAMLLLFANFGAMGEWTSPKVMMVYGLAFASFGIAELFARGYDYFPQYIRTGAFDRILLRPRNTFVQVMGMHFHIHRLSKIAAGVVLIFWSIQRQSLTLSAGHWVQLGLSLLGGSMVYTGVFVLISAISFWTIHALSLGYPLSNGSYQAAKCPPEYMPRWLKNTFTFFVPLFWFSYYPAAAIGGWGKPTVLGWLALPCGLLFLTLALGAWRMGARYYTSTGS